MNTYKSVTFVFVTLLMKVKFYTKYAHVWQVLYTFLFILMSTICSFLWQKFLISQQAFDLFQANTERILAIS